MLPPPPPLPRLVRHAKHDPAAPATVGDSVRVFVHIADPAQLPAADRVRAELSRLHIGDGPVGTPPARIVAGLPRRTEVRCLKHADCGAAGRVARYLWQELGSPVAVVDMSSLYERDGRVRPGSLELWLRA
jgi:hypothetical protein